MMESEINLESVVNLIKSEWVRLQELEPDNRLLKYFAVTQEIEILPETRQELLFALSIDENVSKEAIYWNYVLALSREIVRITSINRPVRPVSENDELFL